MANVPRRLILDEHGLVLRDGNEPGRVLEEFSVFLHECIEGGECLERWSGIYEVFLLPDLALYDLLYGAATEVIDKEVRHHLQRAIDRCKIWDDEPGAEGLGTIVYIDGARVEARSLAFIHHERRQARCAAAIAIRRTSDESNMIEVHVDEIPLLLHRVFDRLSLLAFYRDLFEIADLQDENDFMSHCRVAFPDLHFVPELVQQIRRFETKFQELRPDLVRHLMVLNDCYKQIQAECQGLPKEISRRLGVKGVNMSGESSKTRHNKKAMKEREVVVQDEIGARHLLSCELHTKLRDTCDRVHFHPGRDGLFDGRVIVGIFVDHFTT